jgi:hypothetical protein
MRQGAYAGTFPDQLVLASDGTVWGNNAQIVDLGLPSGGPGEVTGIAIYAGKIWFRRNNGPWNGNAANSPVNNTGGLTIPAGARHYIMSALQLSASVNTAGPFAYPPPSGFGVWPLATLNLPKADSSGFELINKGEIIPSSNFLEVFLPEGYSSFQLRAVGMTFAVQDQLAFVVSYDGGVTVIQDGVNWDSYSDADMILFQAVDGTYFYTSGAPMDATTSKNWYVQGYDVWDQVAYAAAGVTNFDWYMDFTPGDSDHYFKCMIKLAADKIYPNYGGGFGYNEAALTINPAAVHAPAKGRVNMLKVGPYHKLTNSADTTHNMVAGKWCLLGIKG